MAPLTDQEKTDMLLQNPDYISLKRYSYSIDKLMARYPEGCPDHIIADALQVTEAELNKRHKKIILKLRKLMGVEDDQNFS